MSPWMRAVAGQPNWSSCPGPAAVLGRPSCGCWRWGSMAAGLTDHLWSWTKLHCRPLLQTPVLGPLSPAWGDYPITWRRTYMRAVFSGRVERVRP